MSLWSKFHRFILASKFEQHRKDFEEEKIQIIVSFQIVMSVKVSSCD